MAHNPHHVHLIKELREQFEPVLSGSPQAIYIYLDDEHKICNKKFSDLLGYKNPKEWEEFLYPVSDVKESDQAKVTKAYMDVSNKLKGVTLTATLVNKKGKKLKTQVIMTPFTYKDEVFVLHFISPI